MENKVSERPKDERSAKTDILSLTKEELITAILSMGEQKFRAGQIFSWLHKKHAASFDEMTDISKQTQKKLADSFEVFSLNMLEQRISQKDNTRKYLFETKKHNIIESVLMDYEHGLTVCVSTQAGCKMGCGFCASALGGFECNLTAGEILSQIYMIEEKLGKKISRCVLMGTGEPFDNFDNTLRFINIINSKNGQDMGQRNITVSTCGIVPRIKEFADLGTQVNLAVSLHAPNDEIRVKIMPIAKVYDFDSLLEAVRYYTERTNRRVTYEYALIDGLNDDFSHAKELGKRIGGTLCHVNLIPVNEVKELNMKKSNKVYDFLNILQKSGVRATVRRKLGGDIDGACGQLRNRYGGMR